MTFDIVGLDLSLSGTGVSDSGGSRTIKTPSRITKAGGAFRLQWLTREIGRNVSKTSDLAVIEGYSYSSNQTGHHGVVEFGGVVRLWCFKHDIPYVTISPKSLKKYATGNGNANKKAVWKAAVEVAGDVFVDDNAADAFWLRQMALSHYQQAEAVTMPDRNQESLAAVAWPMLTERTQQQ